MKQNTGATPASPAAGQGRRDESHRVAHETTGTAGGENDDRASRQPSTPAIGTCSCYSKSDNDGVLHPVLCTAHAKELREALGDFFWVTQKYERWFATEQDARDRVGILQRMHQHKELRTRTIPVSKWFLVRAQWFDND